MKNLTSSFRLLPALLLVLLTWGAQAQAPTWQSVTGLNAGAGTAVVRGTAVDANGDYYAVGYFYGSLTLGSTTLITTDPNADSDMFVAKMSGSTNTWLWAKQGGGSGLDQAGGVAVSGGTVYVTGHYTTSGTISGTFLTSAGGQDVFVARYTTAGADGSAVSGGGGGSDQGYDIVANGSTVYITGFMGTNATTPVIAGSTLTGAGGQDIFVARYTDNGTNLIGGGARSGGSSSSNERGRSVAVSGSSVYVTGQFLNTATISGTSLTSAGSQDMFVAKYTDNGSGLTENGAVRGGGGAGPDIGYNITAVGSSPTILYVGGTFNSAATISGTALTANSGSQDVFLARFTDSGTGITNGYARSDGGANQDVLNDLAVSGTTLYASGSYTTATTLAGTSLTSNGDDAFVAKYTDSGSAFGSVGAIDGGATATGATSTFAGTIATNGTRFFLGGAVGAPASFGPTAAGGSLQVAGGNTGFVAALTGTAVLPTVTTTAASSVATTSAVLGGNVTADGGATVTERGVVYVVGSGTPTTANTKAVNGAGMGTFSQTVSGLTAATQYTVRAYAINSAGTGYGSPLSFTTAAAPTTVTSIGPAGSSPTNAASVTYTVTFAAAVTGVTATNFSLTATGAVAGAGVTSVSGTGTTYTVTANTGTGSGTLRLNLANATGLSPGVNNVPYTSGTAYTIDKTAPTATIASSTAASGGGSSAATFSYTVTFSEVVTGFVAGDVTVINGAVSGFTAVSGTTYTFNVTPAANGAVTVNVAANAAQDAATNGNTAATQYSITYTQPVPPPTLSGFSPTSGLAGTLVTLTGTNLDGVRGVRFGTGGLALFTAQSAASLTVRVPVDAASGPLTLTPATGNAVVSPAGFTVVARQNLAAVLSPAGPLDVCQPRTLTATASSPGFGVGTGFNGVVNAVLAQADGRVVVGGGSTTYRGSATPTGLVRLNADGTLDAGFSTGAGVAGGAANVAALAAQADGKLLVGGAFGTYRGVAAANLVRLNADGSRDPGFALGTGFDNEVDAVAVQADGKVLVGGFFTRYQGVAARYLVRLNADGSRDNTFAVGTGLAQPVQALAVQANGQVLVGTGFTPSAGASTTGLTRFNADGSFDPSFAVGNGFAGGNVNSLAVQPDGRVLAGGGFVRYQVFTGTAASRIIRLNADASRDNTFAVGTGFDDQVNPVVLQPDGKVLVGGFFTHYQGTAAGHFIRLNTDGSPDTGSNTGTGFDGAVLALAVSADGRALVGGSSTTYQGVASGGLAQLNADGSAHTTATAVSGASFAFAPGNTTTNPLVTSTAGTYTATASQNGETSAPSNAVVLTPCTTAPALTNINPSSAPVGTSVTLTGSNLTGATAVTFAGTSNNTVTTGLTVSGTGSGQTLTVAVPSGAATGNVTVTTPNGTSNGVAFAVTAPAIAIAPATLPGGTRGAAYSQTLTASGGTLPYTYAVTAGALPAGLTLTSGGILAGTPTASGSFGFTVTATDASAAPGPYSGTRAYTISIAAPTITVAPATLASGTVGTAYNQTVTASGGTAPYGYAVTAGALPAGLSLTTGGALAGTPTAGGTFNFTITATDAATAPGPYSGARAYTLTIASPAITVNPAALSNGTVGTAYSQTLTVAGGTAPYTYAATGGVLPTGLLLSAGGTLSGTPTAGGSFNFTVTATDASTGTGRYSGGRAYTVIIAAPTIAISPATLTSGTVGTAYSQTVTASGGTAPYSYAVTSGALPGGLSLSSGGTLAGTPTAGGTFTFTVTATDASTGSGPYSGSRSYSVVINAQPVTAAPVVTAPANGSYVTTTTPTYSGTAPVGSTVTVYVDGTSIGTTTAPVTGAPFSLTQPTGSPLGQGSHTVRATAQSSGQAVSANSATNTFTVDSVAPTVTITSTVSSPTSTSPIPVTVTFSEAVTGFVSGDLTVTGGTVSGFSGSGTTYTFNVTPAGNGTVTVNVPANVAQDAAGNGNTAAPQYSITYAATVTATTWTGTSSTDWFTASNWTPAVVPTATIDATIPGTAPRMPLIASGSAVARNVNIGNGATLAMSDGMLDVNGNWTNNGAFVPTGGTVQFGSTAQPNGPSIGGSSVTRFWNLTVNSGGVLLATAAGASARRLVTLNGAFVTQGNPFVLESDATGTALVVNNGTAGFFLGSVTVQRYISPDANAGLGYRHLSTPVALSPVSALATTGFTPVVNAAYNTAAAPATVSPYPTVYGYDQSRLATATSNYSAFDKGYFSPAALATPLEPGQGYTVSVAAGRAVNFVGPPNNNTLAVPLARNSGATAADAGWQLLGNPYPSPLDYSLVAAADRVNLDGVIYVFTSSSAFAGTYRTYLPAIGSSAAVGDPILPLGQGFFTRVSAGQTSGSLTFRNSQRVTAYQNPTYHRAADPRPLLTLALRGPAAGADALTVYFDAAATAGIDPQRDALKLPNTTGLNLAAQAAGQALAIDGLPALGNTQVVVPLALQVPATGTYTLEATALQNLATTPTYLRDLQTGALVNLAVQPRYTFTLNAAFTGPRFELLFAPQGALATAPASLSAQVAVFPNPATKVAYVELPTALARTAATATLVDALGRAVRTYTLTTATTALPLADVASGVYALRVATTQGTVTKRLVVE